MTPEDTTTPKKVEEETLQRKLKRTKGDLHVWQFIAAVLFGLSMGLAFLH